MSLLLEGLHALVLAEEQATKAAKASIPHRFVRLDAGGQ
jgi:hypothetical protein